MGWGGVGVERTRGSGADGDGSSPGAGAGCRACCWLGAGAGPRALPGCSPSGQAPAPCPVPPQGWGPLGYCWHLPCPAPRLLCACGADGTRFTQSFTLKKKMYSRSYLQQPHGQAGELKWRWPAQSAALLAGPRPGQEPCQGGAWAGAASLAGGAAAVAEAEHPPPRWSRGGPRWLQLKAGAASLRAGVAERTPPRSSSGAAFSWDTRSGGARAQEQGTTRARGRAQSVPAGTTWRH